MDWYSRYCFLKKFRKEADSRDVIDFLEEVLHEYGYPEKLRKDRGPHYRGEFEDFTKRAGIDWKPSSAYHPKSNGHIERQIGIVKNLLDKTLKSRESF